MLIFVADLDLSIEIPTRCCLESRWPLVGCSNYYWYLLMYCTYAMKGSGGWAPKPGSRRSSNYDEIPMDEIRIVRLVSLRLLCACTGDSRSHGARCIRPRSQRAPASSNYCELWRALSKPSSRKLHRGGQIG